MTHQNHQTNGASLEDCHTNFFALTELYGIKWRKLVWGESNGGGCAEGEEGAAPLADPVISSYARCLAGDILCVWRRVPAPQPPPDLYEVAAPAPPPPLSLRAAKELWIFWYGEEPDLSGLVAPELIAGQGDQGSWESGLSYECRSLLFKALHNLIERCLLSRDFVRLGKWFVQPYDGDEEEVGNSPWHLSFSFAFFLHGESTVCASVDVRQHPPVRTLTARRLRRLHSAAKSPDAKVILAPFGLEGVATGREWSDADAGTQRLLDAWRQLYPLEKGCGAVEVVCGGCRLRYPLPYVLLTEMEAAAGPAPPAAALARRALHALTTPAPHQDGRARDRRTIHYSSLHHKALAPRPAPHQSAEVCYSESASDKGDDFVDPTRKALCTCAKWRRRRAPRPEPFHRRPATHAPAHCHAHHAATTNPPAIGSVNAGTCGGGSPGSCGAPSPAHHSAPPSATPPSPPPPPPHAHHQGGGALPTTLHTPAPTPDPLAPPTPAPPSAPSAPPKHYPQGESPLAGGGLSACAGGGAGGGGGGGGAGGWARDEAPLGTRPALPSPPPRVDVTDDEHSLHMLYDYSTVLAWLDHPVKRFKSEENTFREELALGTALGTDLYAGHDHTKMAAMLDLHHVDIKQEKIDHDDTKEYKNLFTSDGLCPTFKDLDQIFENSDDAASGDETVRLLQVQTPPDSNKSVEESRCAGGRCVRAEELSKMFPTPPSMEAHAQPSPGFTLPADEPPPARLASGSPPPDPIEDWSYVFKPPTVCKYVGSSKYAPLGALPSALLASVALPPHAVYRPERPAGRPGVKRSASPTNETRDSRSRRSCEGVTTASPLAANGRGVDSTAGGTRSPATGPAPGPGGGTAPGPPAGPPAPTAGAPARPERPAPAACPLLLNVLLTDTVLNVFRDHNFDSCSLCVCNAGPRVVGNIRGADAATYLPDGAGAAPGGDDEPARCTCGFSAVVNRRLAHRAGLFYEDEMEITGLSPETGGAGGEGASAEAEAEAEAAAAARLVDVAPSVAAACAGPAGGGGRASALARAAARAARPPPRAHRRLNLLEYSDGGAAAARALRAACGSSSSNSSSSSSIGTPTPVHRWPFIGARAPRSSRDIFRLMRRLRPLLQDAIQKRCSGARMWDGVSGPLTWRQFHRLAGRGNEDLCEPQPVPPLLVGHERDWLALSPAALRHWERLALEPYAPARDVAYVALAADCPALAAPLAAFLRDLSAAYEACRLGRHRPLARAAALYRAAPDPAAPDPADPAPDEWAGELPRGRLGQYLRAYADVLRTQVLPAVSAVADRPLLQSDEPGGGNENEDGWESEEGSSAALVIYVVEPPGGARRPAALRALLRLGARVAAHLPHHQPRLQIISLEGLCESWGLGVTGPELSPAEGLEGAGLSAGAGAGGAGGGADMRALAFSVFSSARRLLAHQPHGKSLTGFGTAADANLFLANKDEKNRAPYKLFSPAWVLAPPRALKEVAETWGQGSEQGSVLFLAYCLSHDQRWLLAAATDARGELLDTAAINIHVPPRSRRRRGGPARRLGLRKLMDFTLGVMSQAAQPWRLVVGRVGRVGHGELKGWSWLLSRKNLVRASSTLRELCGSCAALYPAGVPCIVSACLVSTEPDPCLRLMADRFTPDERFSQASIHSHLHTPRDVSATHILVFPTSATTQSNPMPFEQPMANGVDSDMMFLDVDMGDEDMGEDNMTELLIGDMFNNMWPQGSPRASPRRADPGDPASPTAAPPPHCHPLDDSAAEQVGTVLQQPLALGYLVSTAPLGGMPAWWWAGCAHLVGACPAFLKNALHLHAGSLQSDDVYSLSVRRDHNAHPLDSQLTTDVLRYVLEGYNALSWLALDGETHDRRSCLPLHVQALLQLYHTAAALT